MIGKGRSGAGDPLRRFRAEGAVDQDMTPVPFRQQRFRERRVGNERDIGVPGREAARQKRLSAAEFRMTLVEGPPPS